MSAQLLLLLLLIQDFLPLASEQEQVHEDVHMR
jgi:hypothetical protein